MYAEAVVPQNLRHQRVENASGVIDSPVGGWSRGKSEPGERRDNNVKRNGFPCQCHGLLGELVDYRKELQERARPAVEQYEGDSPRRVGFLMDEVKSEALQLGGEMMIPKVGRIMSPQGFHCGPSAISHLFKAASSRDQSKFAIHSFCSCARTSTSMPAVDPRSGYTGSSGNKVFWMRSSIRGTPAERLTVNGCRLKSSLLPSRPTAGGAIAKNPKTTFRKEHKAWNRIPSLVLGQIGIQYCIHQRRDYGLAWHLNTTSCGTERVICQQTTTPFTPFHALRRFLEHVQHIQQIRHLLVASRYGVQITFG
jgi:hypothetical protein